MDVPETLISFTYRSAQIEETSKKADCATSKRKMRSEGQSLVSMPLGTPSRLLPVRQSTDVQLWSWLLCNTAGVQERSASSSFNLRLGIFYKALVINFAGPSPQAQGNLSCVSWKCLCPSRQLLLPGAAAAKTRTDLGIAWNLLGKEVQLPQPLRTGIKHIHDERIHSWGPKGTGDTAAWEEAVLGCFPELPLPRQPGWCTSPLASSNECLPGPQRP